MILWRLQFQFFSITLYCPLSARELLQIQDGEHLIVFSLLQPQGVFPLRCLPLPNVNFLEGLWKK